MAPPPNRPTPSRGIAVAPSAQPEGEDTEPIVLVEPPVVDLGSGPAQILVVDDEPANLQAVEAALEGLPVQILEASSGQEALRHLLQSNVALILLDVLLPTLDGFETARIIRSRSRNRHVPIIFLTAHNQNDEDIRRGYQLGAVDYLFKPFVPEVLRAKVQVFVDLRNRTAEVHRQAAQLRELERQAGERRLREARRAWEADALRRQMDEQRKITAQLEEADRRKDEFRAVLAHELRNPLAPLVAGLELIRMSGKGDPILDRAREAMGRQVDHLVRLVDDLLDVSRISRGKVELQRENVDILDAVRQAIETCQGAVETAGHAMHVELPDEPLICNADLVRLTQIMNNLLGNAIRYTDAGGDISVIATAEDADAVITVRDNGKGISQEMLERIFDMFVQERSGSQGLGLGLTLVDQVVQMHGGTVTARSDGPGHGSEFQVRLPRVDARSVGTQPRVAAGDSTGSPKRIVVVDDEEDIAHTVRAMLEAWGHDVVVADCGQRGIEQILEVEPDLVLLDIGLPDLDGYGVAEEVCLAMGEQRPTLVAVTGYGQPRDRERSRKAGFDAHLVKPARPEDIARVLRDLPRRAPDLSPS